MKSCTLTLTLAFIAAASLAACEKKTASKPPAAKTVEVTKTSETDWCAEHGVPESVCTRCSPKLIADFKQKGDWCDTHKLPKSQCIECDPSLKAKFEAMAPKS